MRAYRSCGWRPWRRRLRPWRSTGDLAAIDRLLKILDRLDRYHGFNKLAPANEDPDEGSRERLLAKLNMMAERMIAEQRTSHERARTASAQTARAARPRLA